MWHRLFGWLRRGRPYATMDFDDPDDFRAACIAVRDRHQPTFDEIDEKLFTHKPIHGTCVKCGHLMVRYHDDPTQQLRCWKCGEPK